jgi:TRAP-type mannitol/chloroaromatic compound transport system permease small subunit
MRALVARLEPVAGWIEQLNENLGRGLAWLVPVMAAVMFGVVVAAYFLNAGSIAVQESVSYLHVLIFLAGAGYTLKHDAHVRVDILYRRWSRRTRAIVDLAGTLVLLLPLFSVILIYSGPYVVTSWARLESSSQVGGLPLVFLLKTFIPLGAALMLLQGLALAIRCLAVITNQPPDGEAAE